MNTELFIARRLSRSGRNDRKGGTENRPAVMVRIATLAVALSMAVMIVAMSVVSGFKQELTSRLRAVVSDIELSAREGSVVNDATLRAQTGGRPYTLKEGVVKTDDAIVGVLLKGIPDSLTGKDIVLSETMARELKVKEGDKIEMLFVGESGMRRDRFRITGFYATGIDEFDRTLAVTRIENVQRLLGYASDRVTGYEVTLPDGVDATAEARRLNELFMENEAWWGLTATATEARFPMVFDWLKTHDVNAMVILTIMVIVALFNMATALLTLVLERTRMIGILKTIGMTNRALQRLFSYRAARIILHGMVWGNAVGLGLCWAQSRFHLLKLDPAGYMLSEVPVSVSWGWWAALNLGTAVVILLLLLIPASIVSRIKPDQAIRHT